MRPNPSSRTLRFGKRSAKPKPSAVTIGTPRDAASSAFIGTPSCSEQITSRALPLLYVNELASSQQLALDTGADQRIRDAIDRLLARQGSNGSFGLWSVGGDEPWLDAYVTDFLTRARERGFVVPDVAFKLALDRLRNFVATAPEPGKDGGRDLAYALYVLARAGKAAIGDLRYYVENKLGNFSTALAKGDLRAYVLLTWLSGSTNRAGEIEVWVGLAACLLLIAPLFLATRWLDLMPLGEAPLDQSTKTTLLE